MKTVQINKVKVRIFEENELREKLGMSEENIKLVSTYQRTFPELLQDDAEGFVINTRTLWEKLNEGAEYATWFKRRSSKLNLVEDVDYSSIDTTVKREKGGTTLKEKYVTLEVAKDIAFLSGTDIGKEVRDYFKLMEKTLRDYEKWCEVREPEKKNANKLKSELKKWGLKNFANCDENGLYAREFNMINKNLTGFTALEIKSQIGYIDKQTREHLTIEVNKTIDFLQEFDINLLTCGMDFDTRDKMIKQICEINYKNIKELFN